MSTPQIEDGYIKIANELFDALCKIRINGEARQILDLIIRKTYGWGKKEDAISLSQFQELTGIKDKKSIIRAINKLKDMNIIIGEKANEYGNIYCINKKYLTWKPLAKKPTVTKKPKGGDEKANKSLAKKPHTINNYTKETITKETITGPELIKIETLLEIPEGWSDIFSLWLDFKINKRQMFKDKKYALICYKRLVELSANNLEKAKLVIEQSIANNYSGLFELKNGGFNNAGTIRKSKFDSTIDATREYLESQGIDATGKSISA